MIIKPRGTKVLVPKGTRVCSTNPSNRISMSKRAQIVNIQALYDFSDRVTWAGSGGYWRWANLEDVEFVDEGKQLNKAEAESYNSRAFWAKVDVKLE